ncbi:MAG: HAD family hydrolase [Clostridia bacterium]|nr:HAD family hydrolase [Clostridia bacterium]
MSKYDLVIWDWNGTLLSDVDVNVRTINILLHKRGIPTIPSREAYLERFRFPVIDYYRELGFNTDVENFSDIADDYINVYNAEARDAGLYDGTREVLEAVRGMGVRQAIVSAADGDRLRCEVKNRGIDTYFTDIIGKGDNRGDGKIALGQGFVNSTGIPANKILFVGDMEHDAELAAACGCDCLLVARGHMSRARLESLGVPVADDIRDVVRYLE